MLSNGLAGILVRVILIFPKAQCVQLDFEKGELFVLCTPLYASVSPTKVQVADTMISSGP
jgi:hypothetical protein